jgi:hypothetical protein
MAGMMIGGSMSLAQGGRIDPVQVLERAAAPHAAEPPIFVHAWWRSGSTYIWLKLRENESCRCYYEPLHEGMGSLKLADMEGPPKSDVSQSLRHPIPKQPYYAEYAALMRSGSLNYSSELAYDRYLLLRGQADDKLRSYIGRLISAACAAKRRAVLCFCRTQMRSAWMKATFGGVHVAQIRNPAGQWASFNMGLGPYFIRHMLIIALKLRNSHPLAFAHIESFERLAHNLAKRPSIPVEQIPKLFVSRSDSLAVFLVIWMASTLQAMTYCDFLLDIDRLSTDLDYRNLASRWFESQCYPADFSDCSVPASSDSSSHSFEQMIEAAAMAIRSHASSLVIAASDVIEKWLPWTHPQSRRALSLALGDNCGRRTTCLAWRSPPTPPGGGRGK